MTSAEILAAPAAAVRRGKILVVDDSDVILEASAIAFEEAGFEVTTLDNPLSVAYQLRKNTPDLLLIDVNMPALTGDSVAKIVSSHGLSKRVPVVLYSDLPAAELEERARRCGANGFVRKGCGEEELVRRVTAYMPRRDR
jgi:DNA-binding response OmpR family regulator